MNSISYLLNTNNKNNKWPPSLNKYILIKKNMDNNQFFCGKVIKIIKKSPILIHLIKGFNNHDRDVIEHIKPLSDPTKFMLVYNTDKWNYITESDITEYILNF